MFSTRERQSGDILGIVLTVLGFLITTSATAFGEHARLMSVVGAAIAGVGLVIGLASLDLPAPVGWLNEGIDSGIAGLAVYYAKNG